VCSSDLFYQYRLAARALEQPVEGLDALDRGTLLHAVLECFWRGRDSAWLQSLDETDLQQAVAGAVTQGLRTFAASRDEPLTAGFQDLERQRLQRLLSIWLDYERQRQPFTVADCERKLELSVTGLSVRLSLDRVDRLADGRMVVIDYKTGSRVDHKSWAANRIREPQLPLYAALALAGGEVAAVCFAKVRGDEQKFVGIAADPDLLPDVKGLEAARNLFPQHAFPDWTAVLDHWRGSIEAVAREILAGDAAVRFEDESELRDCEVKPLLRLAERRLQLERGEGDV
jgi:exodeoxyribonuclease-5